VQAVHPRLDALGRLKAERNQLVVDRLFHIAALDDAAEVLVRHRDGAVDQVAEDVGEVGIDALDHQLIRDRAVGGKGHLMQHIIAHRVHAEILHKIVGIDDVAF